MSISLYMFLNID